MVSMQKTFKLLSRSMLNRMRGTISNPRWRSGRDLHSGPRIIYSAFMLPLLSISYFRMTSIFFPDTFKITLLYSLSLNTVIVSAEKNYLIVVVAIYVVLDFKVL